MSGLRSCRPRQWYDQNDSFGLELYGKQRGGQSVYALCLAEAPEHAHHWQIFADHSHGLCIQFDREGLLEHMDGFAGHVLHGPVEYMTLKKIRALEPIPTERLPFLKRDTFKSEDEYRILAWQKTEGGGDKPAPAAWPDFQGGVWTFDAEGLGRYLAGSDQAEEQYAPHPVLHVAIVEQ